MRLSRYFLPVLKDAPAEAEIVSHKLMLRAGMIQQLSAGIYSWLPLGFAVLKKVEQIVREEMNSAGAIEILMPTIQPADLWRESGRYEAYGKEMLRPPCIASISIRHAAETGMAEAIPISTRKSKARRIPAFPKHLGATLGATICIAGGGRQGLTTGLAAADIALDRGRLSAGGETHHGE